MPNPLKFRAHMHANCHFSGLKANQFRKVPVEIVDAILRFLIHPDQICFALSCKGINVIYAQQKHSKSAPRLESIMQKTDLRLRLQNKRWIYCTQCSIPHWCSMWRKIQSWLSLNDTFADCRLGTQIWHRPPFTGQVDICPCSTFSFYKHQLLSYLCRNPDIAYQALRQQQQQTQSNPNIGCDEIFVEFAHNCTFDKHPSVETRIRTTLWFDETSKSLQVLNQFKFDISKAGSSHLGPFGRTSSNSCFHKDTKRWLEDFFRRSKSSFRINTQDHSWCQWLGWDTSHTFEVLLHRNLGDSKWPDRRWKSHCHN